eukprot:Gregarina_sp_Poly_1__7072@NODE_3866_length_849_cov_65_659847_g165_i3_p1_GENE_NODE_3866_length_849_cov_65_659847_g165_i3NODE_3866_length_849_cov_65_659847_g165_i3_p1_ORF_typecomplete_len204_score40_83PDEase_I/PF00233_19/1_8e24_NODE_3866_length_849_cov_65_659847_g165_i352663
MTETECKCEKCGLRAKSSLTLKLLMKAADLSHGALDWPIHQQLSMAVNEEFWAQGDAEEKLGLPKSPLCDRAKAHEMSKQQVSFLEFILVPLYNEISAVDPSGNVASTCETLIKANIAKWKVMAASQSPVPVDSMFTSEKVEPLSNPSPDREDIKTTRGESGKSVTYNIDLRLSDDAAASPSSKQASSQVASNRSSKSSPQQG